MSARLNWPEGPPQAVLFDLDGTLADTAGDLGGALNALRRQRGLAPLPLELLRPHASAGARGLLGAGLDVHPGDAEFDTLRQAFLAEYAQCLADTTALFPGVDALLQALEARGLPWGVVTNKPHRFTVPVLEGLGLSARARTVVSGDSTAHPKPHPLPMFTACEAIGATPARVLYVGDDLRDVQAAHAAGMPCAAAAWGYLGQGLDVEAWQADVICREPGELLALL